MLPEPWGHPQTLNHRGEGCSEPLAAPFSPSQWRQAMAATSIHPAGGGGISSRAAPKNDPKITDFSADLNQGRFSLQSLPPARPPGSHSSEAGSCLRQLRPGRVRPPFCFPRSQRVVEAPVPGAVSSAATGHGALLPFLRASSDLARNLLVTVVYKAHMHPRLTFNGKNLSAASSEVGGHPK